MSIVRIRDRTRLNLDSVDGTRQRRPRKCGSFSTLLWRAVLFGCINFEALEMTFFASVAPESEGG